MGFRLMYHFPILSHKKDFSFWREFKNFEFCKFHYIAIMISFRLMYGLHMLSLLSQCKNLIFQLL